MHVMSTPDEATSDLDTVRGRLNVVTQETRFSLIQDILGHPSGLPTLKELDYVNPSRSQTTIRQHLQRLVEAGIVSADQLRIALTEQDRDGAPLGRILIRLGFVTEAVMREQLGEALELAGDGSASFPLESARGRLESLSQ